MAGPVVIVTGAAGGIGRAAVLAFAQSGARVVAANCPAYPAARVQLTDDCTAHIAAAKLALTTLLDESRERHQRWRALSRLLRLPLDGDGNITVAAATAPPGAAVGPPSTGRRRFADVAASVAAVTNRGPAAAAAAAAAASEV